MPCSASASRFCVALSPCRICSGVSFRRKDRFKGVAYNIQRPANRAKRRFPDDRWNLIAFPYISGAARSNWRVCLVAGGGVLEAVARVASLKRGLTSFSLPPARVSTGQC